MILYPAIDLRRSRVVRLSQGNAAKETVYSHDPVAQAQTFVADGATWLHVVDLDGALEGEAQPRPLDARLATRVPCGQAVLEQLVLLAHRRAG